MLTSITMLIYLYFYLHCEITFLRANALMLLLNLLILHLLPIFRTVLECLLYVRDKKIHFFIPVCTLHYRILSLWKSCPLSVCGIFTHELFI